MSDLIDRQAAIEAILAIKDYGNSDRANALGLAECAITTLPSAQPEYYDYSDIDLVWKYYAEEQDINLTDGAKQLKDAMWVGYRKGKQDAQPEIIRCKDCKLYRTPMPEETYCSITGFGVDDNDYCSYAERQEE